MELSDSHKISQEKRDFKISDVLITARPYRFHLFQTALFRYFLKFQTSKKRFHLLFTYEGSFERPSQVRSNFIRAISLTVKAGGS